MITDYPLRRAVGIVGLALPLVLYAIAGPRESLSAYYFSPARDVFVGLLFLLGGMLWAYRGHDHGDRVCSAVASVGLAVVALAPTGDGFAGALHLAGAGMFFLASALLADRVGRGGYRAKTLRAVGLGIVAILGTVILGVPVVLAEAGALGCFGAGWLVKGRALKALASASSRPAPPQ